MFGSNTTKLAQDAWDNGHKDGVESVMISFNDMLYNDSFTVEERKILRKAYKLLEKEFPCEEEDEDE